MNSKDSIILIFAAIAFVFFCAWIITLRKAISSSGKLRETEAELSEVRQIASRNQLDLIKTSDDLARSRSSFNNLSQKLYATQRELTSKSNAHRKACDALIVINFERRELLAKLTERDKECDELSKAFGDHLATHDSQPSSAFEAKVYVNKSRPSKYHCVIHGNWSGYKLIPLRSAIDKGYSPCAQCFANLEKEYVWTGNYPKYSLNAPVPSENNITPTE